jgi:hypothetical protein
MAREMVVHGLMHQFTRVKGELQQSQALCGM